MRLDANASIIPAEKVRDYLLSPTHTIGRYKSEFFRSLGYTQELWQVLESDLRATLSGEAQPTGATQYGQKFAVQGDLQGQTGGLGGFEHLDYTAAGDSTSICDGISRGLSHAF